MSAETDLARILLATQRYSDGNDASVAWWGVWLDQARAAGFALDSLELVASARGQRLGCSVWRPGNESAVRAVDVMLSAHAVTAEERDLLFAVAMRAGTKDHALGLWAAQRTDHFEGGWGISGDFDLSFARSIAGDALESLEQICSALERDRVRRMTRQVADGVWEIEVDLADAPLEQVWDALGCPRSAPVRRWLEQPTPPRAHLSARLGDEVAFALAVPLTSSRDLAFGLAAAGIDEGRDDALAAIAGALDATPRSLVLALAAGALDALVEL